jgi:hypothetical protein
MKNYFEEIQALTAKAEESRLAGNREDCLSLKKQVEQLQYEQVQEQHQHNLTEAKKIYNIGVNIPGLGTVTEIKDGCGIKSGWINVYFGDKNFTPIEISRKLLKIKAEDQVNNSFRSLKFSDKKALYIGEYDETLDALLIYMGLDKIWTLEQWDNNNIDCFSESYSYAKEQAITDGYTDEEAEEKARESEDIERNTEYNKYKQNVLEAINYLLNYAELELIEKKNKYYISAKSWKESAGKMAEIITGYGTFEYKSGKELKDGLPAKTYCEAVIKHLHWLKHAPEVYGAKNYDYMMR